MLGVGVIIGLVLVVVLYVAATFNPNDYKGKIIQAVKENTQRTLSIGGDIRLSFYPRIGAELGKVSFSDFRSDSEFASVESVHISLALIPEVVPLPGHKLPIMPSRPISVSSRRPSK